MKIVPEIKEYVSNKGKITVKNIKWCFSDEIDERLKKAALRIAKNSVDGFEIILKAGDKEQEDYKLVIEHDKIIIESNGAAGVFYGLQTLDMLIKENKGELECCEIYDAPDMKYRGFYHDVTRGRVPTLDSLKKLVDKMASLKLNSLQLYVEHAYEFDEYKNCRDLGYLTKSEMQELDLYCKERFIDLIPSMASFGHLYHLLEEEKYRHLSELRDFKPVNHYWIERMAHHTINPELDESFELIKSLIDQYLEVFTSNYFNICCDETFDLGSGVNAGKDKGELYFSFVIKLIDYLLSKGKQVMMWGDIILQHPEYIKKIPENVIFLNWDYWAHPNEENFKIFQNLNKIQIVCPGTNSWNALTEYVRLEEINIGLLSEYGYRYSAFGILNTNWGDLGNICSLDLSMYGLLCGAAAGWNRDTIFDSEFRKNASVIIWDDEDIMDLIAELSELRTVADWCEIIRYQGALEHGIPAQPMNISKQEYENAAEKCRYIEKIILEKNLLCENMKQELLTAIRGTEFFISWNAANAGFSVKCSADFAMWEQAYRTNWLKNNKQSELEEVLRIFRECEKRRLELYII